MAGFNHFEREFQEPILRGMAEITVRSDLVWDVWRGGKIGFKVDLPLLKEFWRETWSTRFFDLRSGRILGRLALREQNTQKIMIFMIWPEIFLVSGETLDLWNWTLVMSVWAEKGTNRKVFDRRICLWPSQIWETWFREVFGWKTSRVQVVYIANLRGRWNERVASEIF